jgi:hypothetical protein
MEGRGIQGVSLASTQWVSGRGGACRQEGGARLVEKGKGCKIWEDLM